MPKCSRCKKSGFRCRCVAEVRGAGTKEKAPTKVVDRNGKTRTVVKATGNTVRNGVTWCGACSCRMNNGTCSNVTCSTRK